LKRGDFKTSHFKKGGLGGICGKNCNPAKKSKLAETSAMGKYKENPKYNVLSIRVTNEEKAFLSEMIRDTHKSVSIIMREAMRQYTSYINGPSSR
jgi:hypothetical protein